MDNYYVSKLIPLIAEAGLHATPNPLINITLQGRHDTYPKRRGMTRVPELRAAGINVSFGHDCVMDPWYPLGQADMLEVAIMGIHAAPMTSREAMRWAFDAVTVNPAKAMHLEGYGLEKGCNADFVVLQANDPIEAIRLKANRLFVVRRGKVIAETPERVSELHLDGRPAAGQRRRLRADRSELRTVDEFHEVEHDAVQVEILRRVDARDAELLQHQRVLRRNDAAGDHRDVAEARAPHPVHHIAHQRHMRARQDATGPPHATPASRAAATISSGVRRMPS